MYIPILVFAQKKTPPEGRGLSWSVDRYWNKHFQAEWKCRGVADGWPFLHLYRIRE